MAPSEAATGLDQTDLILVLLAAPTDDRRQRFRCDGITRLEKLLFLLSAEEDYKDFASEVQEPFSFEPYHYGPYSADVYDAVDLLKTLRLLSERRVDVNTGLDASEESEVFDAEDLSEPDSYIERQFTLTEDGKAVAKLLSTRLSPRGKEILSQLKDRFGRMPLRQLLRYVYSNHEPYTTKSRIRSSVL
jgi:uncharacterized protein YwgA